MRISDEVNSDNGTLALTLIQAFDHANLVDQEACQLRYRRLRLVLHAPFLKRSFQSQIVVSVSSELLRKVLAADGAPLDKCPISPAQ
jgi:hypothetical protein